MTNPTKKEKRRIEKAGDVVYDIAVTAMRRFVEEYPYFDNGRLSLEIGYNNRKRIGYKISTSDGKVIQGSFHTMRLLRNKDNDFQWAASVIYGRMQTGFLSPSAEDVPQ